MTYRWVQATSEGKWLAVANGPSIGRESSLQAKGDRMLSATLFSSIVANKYSSETCNTKYISNNQALIQKYKEHLEFDIPYQNTTLQAEYYIIKQTYQIKKLHEITASLHWVWGPQDIKKAINNLPVEAQLNIGTNEFANKWQDEHHSKYHPILYAYPGSPAQLIINDHAVTCQHWYQLIQVYIEPRYIGHLQYKFRWSNETVQWIAWKSLSFAEN